MSMNRVMRLCSLVALSTIILETKPQQMFDVDTTFRAGLESWYVNSILPLDDGSLIASGQMRLPEDLVGTMRSIARFNGDGILDPAFPASWGGGRLTRWQDKLYVQNFHTVRRISPDGALDQGFIPMNLGPYFSSFQGGDYHVYPDGRILMSGLHYLSDTVRGFSGAHCLIWFSNEGYLDTTKVHRKCAGSLDVIKELPDGRFIGTLGNPTNTASWDEELTGSNIIRVHADGTWDPSFPAHVWTGLALGFLPLDDGRVYAAGLFLFEGIADTLHLVRFMPDGSLDPTFNNTIKFRITDMTTHPWGALPRKIYQLDEGRLIITGAFEEVEGQVRRCIALVDTNGYLQDDHFIDAGAGNFTYQGGTGSVISGIIPAPDGNWYVWGAYHGYNDGTTNDAEQRFISRLYGPHVGVAEVSEEPLMRIYPNPAHEKVTFIFDLVQLGPNAILSVRDALGREVYQENLPTEQGQVIWDTRNSSPGLYMVSIYAASKQLETEKLIIQR